MILVITALRALLQNRLHRTVFLVFWLLAALRLAVPGVLSSSVSVYNFLPSEEGYAVVEIKPAISYGPDNTIATGEVPVEITEGPADSAPVVYPVGGPAVNTMQIAPPVGEIILPWIWAGGSGICFLYFAWIHIRARLRYRFALPEEGPAYLGRIRLKRSDEISAPLVYGFFRPVILLPVDFPKKDSPEYEQVLYHELTHVRSGDLWYKLGMLLVTCVHWFNPLVWLMLHLSTQDLELRCDARVIRKLGKKKAYAIALLKAETHHTEHFAEVTFAFSLTEMRLRAITGTRVYLPRSILLCTVLTVMLLCCFATGPVTAGYIVIDIEDNEICDSALLLQPPTEDNSGSCAFGDEQGPYMTAYSNDAEQSLKDGRTVATVSAVPKHEAVLTISAETDTDGYHDSYADPSEPVVGSADSGQSSPKEHSVRGSNGKQYNVNVEEFTTAFSGKAVWATNPGETFDPFHP